MFSKKNVLKESPEKTGTCNKKISSSENNVGWSGNINRREKFPSFARRGEGEVEMTDANNSRRLLAQ
jgi:hypothetical protein